MRRQACNVVYASLICQGPPVLYSSPVYYKGLLAIFPSSHVFIYLFTISTYFPQHLCYKLLGKCLGTNRLHQSKNKNVWIFYLEFQEKLAKMPIFYTSILSFDLNYRWHYKNSTAKDLGKRTFAPLNRFKLNVSDQYVFPHYNWMTMKVNCSS